MQFLLDLLGAIGNAGDTVVGSSSPSPTTSSSLSFGAMLGMSN